MIQSCNTTQDVTFQLAAE